MGDSGSRGRGRRATRLSHGTGREVGNSMPALVVEGEGMLHSGNRVGGAGRAWPSERGGGRGTVRIKDGGGIACFAGACRRTWPR